jgi:hypothetical protein
MSCLYLGEKYPARLVILIVVKNQFLVERVIRQIVRDQPSLCRVETFIGLRVQVRWSSRPALAYWQPLIDIDDVHTLAQRIVDTIRDPLLVLDQHLRVVNANRACCSG